MKATAFPVVLSCLHQLREAAKKEDKRQQKRRSESKANKERLRSKQKTLLLDFGRSSSASANDGGAASASSGSSKGGAMLESMPWEVLWQVCIFLPKPTFFVSDVLEGQQRGTKCREFSCGHTS